MNGRFTPFLTQLLGLAFLFQGASVLKGQVAPTATPLRSYDKGFHEPVRLATDTAGRLYVADPRLGLITIRDESGHLLGVRRGFDRPLGLAVDASGRIFVCEAGKGRVAIFTPDWVPAGALGQGEGEFQMPNHIQITPDGLVYVVDSAANLVKVYGPDNQVVRQFGGSGRLNGQLNFPTGLAVTSVGEIFVSDQGNERIQVFDATGAFLRKFGGTLGMLGSNTTFGRVQGLLADGQGRIYLADAFRGVVKVVTATGAVLGTIGAFGTDPGQLKGPSSLALDRNNRLFVATPGNTRVEIFGLDAYTDPSPILFANLTVNPYELRRDDTSGRSPRGSHHPSRGNHQVNRQDDDRQDDDRQDDDRQDEGRRTDQRQDVRSAPLHPKLVSVLVKIPGVDPSSIQESSITANGIPAAHVPGAFIGDFDGDGNFEFRVWFNKTRLVATMPDGEAFLVLSGRLTDGRAFESIADIRVISSQGSVQ